MQSQQPRDAISRMVTTRFPKETIIEQTMEIPIIDNNAVFTENLHIAREEKLLDILQRIIVVRHLPQEDLITACSFLLEVAAVPLEKTMVLNPQNLTLPTSLLSVLIRAQGYTMYAFDFVGNGVFTTVDVNGVLSLIYQPNDTNYKPFVTPLRKSTTPILLIEDMSYSTIQRILRRGSSNAQVFGIYLPAVMQRDTVTGYPEKVISLCGQQVEEDLVKRSR